MADYSVDVAEPWVRELLKPGYTHTDISVHNILLTAWVQALTNWLDSSGVVLILGTHNRDLEHAMLQTMGCFVTSYPLYIESNILLTAAEAVAATHSTLQKIPHRGTRYALLQSEPEWRRQIYQYSQPFLGFNYLGDDELVSGAWQTTPETISHQQVVVSRGTQQNERYKSVNSVPYLVMLSKVNRKSNTLTFTAEYAANCYSTDTVDQLLNTYRKRIASLWPDVAQA